MAKVGLSELGLLLLLLLHHQVLFPAVAATFTHAVVVADVVPLLVLQGVTVEQVCRELRSLYAVKNLSSDSSVSMTCEPSLSANNEIHVSIVSHVTVLTFSRVKNKSSKCF